MFINYTKALYKQTVDNQKANRKPHALALDRYAPHLDHLRITTLVMSLNVQLVQFPRSSHITQPLDIAEYGIFTSEVVSILQSFPRRSGGKIPVKSDIVNVIRDVFYLSITQAQVKAPYFMSANPWPVGMHRTLNRPRGRVAPATQVCRGTGSWYGR